MPQCHAVKANPTRTICFVTGSRAEFGLMESTLRAIQRHPALRLRIIATGMHLSARQGKTVRELQRQGWTIDRTVPWSSAATTPAATAVQTGKAMAKLAELYEALGADIVLVVGDRVEAFAAASAATVGQRVVAHVHGGDRAVGQVDDALRHAITKLAHLHFAATAESAARIERLGEDPWRIHCVGAPGIDGIKAIAAPRQVLSRQFPDFLPRRFGLLVLHPEAGEDRADAANAALVLDALRTSPIDRVLVIYPNNDPGSAGIIRVWDEQPEADGGRFSYHRNLSRSAFLGLLRDAAVLVGNSSSGIIEAASFGTPVINIGRRQLGRQQSENVTDVPFRREAIARTLRSVWNHGQPQRFDGTNVYGGQETGRRIAQVLARVPIDQRLLRKLIVY